MIKINKINFYHANIPGGILRISPLPLLFVTFCIGLTLCVWSFLIGCGFFSVGVKLYFPDGTSEVRNISLGYISQLNYGPWYLIFCPLLYFFSALTFQKKNVTSPYGLKQPKSLSAMGKQPPFIALGLLLTILLIWKNVAIEFEHYDSLGLGWVQAESIATMAKSISITSNESVFDGKIFGKISATSGTLRQANKIALISVQPTEFNVRSHREMITFIGIAKSWSGLWDALVLYISIVTAFWCKNIYSNLKPEIIKNNVDEHHGLIWFIHPVIYIFCIGILVNIFSIMRYISNVAKGSFGQWDQYWSYLTLTPGPIVFVSCLFLLYRIQNHQTRISKNMFPKSIIAVAGFWLTTYSAIWYLLIGFHDPYTKQLIDQITPIL